jgi:SAM-dependent methyltransferase
MVESGGSRIALAETPERARCPVCRGTTLMRRFGRPTTAVDPTGASFRPSAELFGYTSGEIMRCLDCGHGSVPSAPPEDAVMEAYADASDPVSLREEEGQVETARRALVQLETIVPVGRILDLGCWTGSFLVAARERGWDVAGVEPSAWGATRARERGVDIVASDLFDHGQPPGSVQLVVLCDVLEHLLEPRRALSIIHDVLAPGGAAYITVPNAGSVLARALGRRWWSVLPMHLQYFTRASLGLALESEGLTPRRMTSHAKAFTARYYAERLSGYSAPVGRAAVGALGALRLADRMVAPDFQDRLAVTATRD